jgi:hypothetical protein
MILLEHSNIVSIILTCTVNVTSLSSFQVNKQDRINTYLRSIKKWLTNTKFNIIVVENSGYDFKELIEDQNKFKDRFEIITFIEKPENYPTFQMHLESKGGLEINSIHYAYNNSRFLQKSTFIIKITGRFFIKDFENFLNKLHIKLDCRMLDEKFNVSKNELNIKFSNEVIEHITEKFRLDYVDGNYSNDKYYQK